MRCPKCAPKHYFGWLWVPNWEAYHGHFEIDPVTGRPRPMMTGQKSPPCPNCGSALENVPRH